MQRADHLQRFRVGVAWRRGERASAGVRGRAGRLTAGCCLLALLACWGCSRGETPAPPANSADDSIAAARAELSPEDRALAEAQGICPVGGGKLGSMGKPYAVEVKGRKVFLCCQGCEEELRSNPDKYLAILDDG